MQEIKEGGQNKSLNYSTFQTPSIFSMKYISSSKIFDSTTDNRCMHKNTSCVDQFKPESPLNSCRRHHWIFAGLTYYMKVISKDSFLKFKRFKCENSTISLQLATGKLREVAYRTLDKRCLGLKRAIFNAKCSFFRISWLENSCPLMNSTLNKETVGFFASYFHFLFNLTTQHFV